MASPGDAEGVTASMVELSVEAAPSSSGTEIAQHANGDVAAADIWDDASDSPGHASNLDREWIHRQNQFHKMGYRDGITEGKKDSAQEGFNVGFRQSVNVGYKWGLVCGVTSALASLPDSLKEKPAPNAQCRRKILDVHSSVQEISADDALQMFHESICHSNHPSEELHAISTADGATEFNRIKSLSKDLVLLLHEFPDIKVSEELAWYSRTNWPGIAATRNQLSLAESLPQDSQITEFLPGLCVNDVIHGSLFWKELDTQKVGT